MRCCRLSGSARHQERFPRAEGVTLLYEAVRQNVSDFWPFSTRSCHCSRVNTVPPVPVLFPMSTVNVATCINANRKRPKIQRPMRNRAGSDWPVVEDRRSADEEDPVRVELLYDVGKRLPGRDRVLDADRSSFSPMLCGRIVTGDFLELRGDQIPEFIAGSSAGGALERKAVRELAMVARRRVTQASWRGLVAGFSNSKA